MSYPAAWVKAALMVGWGVCRVDVNHADLMDGNTVADKVNISVLSEMACMG